MSDQLPPHDEAAEKSVLSCLLQSPDLIDDCRVKLRDGEKSFFDERLRLIYRTLCQMRDASQTIDLVTLHIQLNASGRLDQIGGDQFIAQLADFAPHYLSFDTYAQVVREKYLLRKVLRCCARAVEVIHANGEPAAGIIGKIQTAFTTLDTNEQRTSSALECVAGLTEDLSRRSDVYASGDRTGITTGFEDFDKMTDGLQFGEQTIVAARPSIGKTALGMNIVDRVCLQTKIPTAVFTLEMSRDALMRRLFSCHCSVPMGAVRRGTLTDEQHQAYAAFTNEVCKSPLYVVDMVSGADANQLASELRRLTRKHGVRFALVDYLQKIHAPERHEKRTYEVGRVSGILRAACVETKVALMTLAQLSRESEKDKGRFPRLGDLADSGQIERDADCVALLHRSRTKGLNHEATLNVAKQRDGETGTIKLNFNGQYCRFENIEEEGAV